MIKKQYTIIGCGTGWGSGYNGTGRAPKALYDFGLLDQLHGQGVDVTWQETVMPVRPNPQFDARLDEAYHDVLTYSQGLERVVCHLAKTSEATPIFIGGDHSMAFATWSGLINGLEAHDEFGLIWVDAHMDAHTPVTSVQGKWGGHFHGMPLAHLLGHGDKALCELGDTSRKINPEYLVLLGIRSYEPGEKELLDSLGVRIFYIEELQERGLQTCINEAIEIVESAQKGWGFSIDLDAFDPKDTPAVGTPEDNGLRLSEFISAVSQPNILQGLKAIEVTEYNVLKDTDDKITAQAACDILKALTI
jgi:arginase